MPKDRIRKTWENLKFTPQADVWHRDIFQNFLIKKKKNNNKTHQTPEKGENLISSVTTLLDSNAQFSTKKNPKKPQDVPKKQTNKNQPNKQKLRNYGPFKGKK